MTKVATKNKTLTIRNVIKLSEAVAIHVMGWEILPGNYENYRRYALNGEFVMNVHCWDITPSHHWMMVVDAMHDEEFDFNVSWQANTDPPDIEFSNDKGDKGWAFIGSFGIAVGLAALRAKGLEVKWKGDCG